MDRYVSDQKDGPLFEFRDRLYHHLQDGEGCSKALVPLLWAANAGPPKPFWRRLREVSVQCHRPQSVDCWVTENGIFAFTCVPKGPQPDPPAGLGAPPKYRATQISEERGAIVDDMGCGASVGTTTDLEKVEAAQDKRRRQRRGGMAVQTTTSFEDNWAHVVFEQAKERARTEAKERRSAGRPFRVHRRKVMNVDMGASSFGPQAGDAIDLDQYGLTLLDARKSMDPTPPAPPPPGVIVSLPPDRDSHENHVRKIVRFLEQLTCRSASRGSRNQRPPTTKK
eukprot:s1955_g12.t1